MEKETEDNGHVRQKTGDTSLIIDATDLADYNQYPTSRNKYVISLSLSKKMGVNRLEKKYISNMNTHRRKASIYQEREDLELVKNDGLVITTN